MLFKTIPSTEGEARRGLQAGDTSRHSAVACVAGQEPAWQERAGPGLTVDGQRGLALLVAGSKAVPPSLGPLRVGNEEPVLQPILLEGDSVLGAELGTRPQRTVTCPVQPLPPWARAFSKATAGMN